MSVLPFAVSMLLTVTLPTSGGWDNTQNPSVTIGLKHVLLWQNFTCGKWQQKCCVMVSPLCSTLHRATPQEGLLEGHTIVLKIRATLSLIFVSNELHRNCVTVHQSTHNGRPCQDLAWWSGSSWRSSHHQSYRLPLTSCVLHYTILHQTWTWSWRSGWGIHHVIIFPSLSFTFDLYSELNCISLY